jgi:CubicO group peptidase (beta-lactamase class C family)
MATSAPTTKLAHLSAQSEGLTDPAELGAFLDPLLADLMAANHTPGGAIAVVKDGQLFFAKGYGCADLEHGTPATADTTPFRVGSISKVFTWTVG